MKVEKELNKLIIYLYDKDKYKKDYIKDTLVKVFNELNEYYDFKFNNSYNLELYINKYYGMILEIQENDYDIFDDDIVNLKLNILNDTLFLYEVEEPLDYLDNEIYYYDDKFFININKINLDIYENANIIYGNYVYKIIGRGIKL